MNTEERLTNKRSKEIGYKKNQHSNVVTKERAILEYSLKNYKAKEYEKQRKRATNIPAQYHRIINGKILCYQ